jgi:uncharacterized protein (DUF2267 family)
LQRLAQDAGLAGPTHASYTATAIATLLRERLTEGQLENVLAMLPAEVQAVLT